MNSISRRREAMGYTHSVPRCLTCVQYRKLKMLVDVTGERHPIPPRCALGQFAVKPHAVCNSWEFNPAGTGHQEGVVIQSPAQLAAKGGKITPPANAET